MRAAIIVPHLQSYGGIRRFLELGNEFVKLGHEWNIYTKSSNSLDWFDFLGNIKQKWADIIDNDVLIIGDTTLFKYFDSWPKLKIMYVISTSPACGYIETYKKMLEYIDSGFLSIFCSTTTWNFYDKLNPLNIKQHFLIPGGINISNFSPKMELRNPEPTIIFYSCLDMPRKHGEDIFNTIKDLGYKMITFSREEVSYNHLNLTKYINPNNLELPNIYNKAHIYIGMEDGAGWNNTGAEALSCGLNIISNGNGSSDFAINNETAIIIKDFTEIPSALEKLKDTTLSQKLSANGLEKIKEFSWQVIAEKLERIIKERI